MTTLTHLAERVEAASGPDQSLSDDILLATGIGSFAENITASLDCAMSLLDGVLVLISLSEIKGDGMPMCIVGNARDSRLFEAVADPPASEAQHDQYPA